MEARRTSNEAEQRYDLFSGLLDASQNESDDEAALSDDELIGKYSNVVPLFMTQEHPARYPRQHVYLPSCWTRGVINFFIGRTITKTLL